MPSLRSFALAAVALAFVTLPARADDVEKYLIDETEGVISVNVRQWLDSPLMKKFGLDKILEGEGDAQKTLKDLGMDPTKDVSRVVVGTGSGDDSLVLIVLGKFDPEKFHAKAEAVAKDRKDNFKVHKTESGLVYEVAKLDEILPLPAQLQGVMNLKGKSYFMVVADKGAMVIAPTKDGAILALDKAAGKKTTKIKNKELLGLLGKVDPKQTISVAMPGGTPGVDKIKSITGGVTIGADVVLDVTVANTDADAAKELDQTIQEQLEAIKGIVGALVFQNKALAPVMDVLSAVKSEAVGKDVKVKGTVKGETVENLVKALAALQGGGGF